MVSHLFLLLSLFCLSLVFAEVPDLTPMSVEELKSLLKDRGFECPDCESHEDFADLLRDHWDDMAPDFWGMNVKTLKGHLKDRGITCEVCAEKKEFIELLEEHWFDPLVTEEKANKEDAAESMLHDAFEKMKTNGGDDNGWGESDEEVDMNMDKMFESFRDMGFDLPGSSINNLKSQLNDARKNPRRADGSDPNEEDLNEVLKDLSEDDPNFVPPPPKEPSTATPKAPPPTPMDEHKNENNPSNSHDEL